MAIQSGDLATSSRSTLWEALLCLSHQSYFVSSNYLSLTRRLYSHNNCRHRDCPNLRLRSPSWNRCRLFRPSRLCCAIRHLRAAYVQRIVIALAITFDALTRILDLSKSLGDLSFYQSSPCSTIRKQFGLTLFRVHGSK